jgi:hypothetical protein
MSDNFDKKEQAIYDKGFAEMHDSGWLVGLEHLSEAEVDLQAREHALWLVEQHRNPQPPPEFMGGCFWTDDGPEAECQGKKVDMTITMTLGELAMSDAEEVHRLFEKKIGTDEMGGLKLGFLSIVDEDTVLLSVKGTVDEYAEGSVHRHIAINPSYRGSCDKVNPVLLPGFGPCVPSGMDCKVPEHWKWED